MMKIFLVIILIVYISFACKEIKNTDDYLPQKSNPKFETVKGRNDFKDIFRFTSILELEYSPHNLFGRPWQIYSEGRDIYIVDLITNKRVFQFSHDGKYKGNIGNSGKGPGEYLNPSAVTLTSKYVVIYDPSLMKVILYNKSKNEFFMEWRVQKYYENMVSLGDTLVFLVKYGHGYEYDLELYDLSGYKISSQKLPRSLAENKRVSLFGGSFMIKKLHHNILYIGADEYRAVYYDTRKESCVWVSNKFPGIIKTPPIPQNLQSRRLIAWMKENYSSLYDVLTFDNGLIMIIAGEYFVLLDDKGNLLSTIKNLSVMDLYFTDGKKLYQIPVEELKKAEQSDRYNPKIMIYSLSI